ncbi:MAG: NAD(P)-binding domain-containing protein [Candidatus Binatia bacterium]
MNEQIETVIIGGGHAGLTMGYCLSQVGREYVIFERARIAERWRSERWDSFTFQFPNWTIELPGYKYQCDDPDGFAPGKEVVRFIENYAAIIKAPVRCGVRVTSLRRKPKSDRYLIQTESTTIEAENVIIATGGYQEPAIPPISAHMPMDVFQIHSSRYRNPDQLPPGAILVVGSGASGCQIAEDLYQRGRTVYLSVGRHLRVPRRYRGRDYGWWRTVMGGWDRTVDMLPSLEIEKFPATLLTGVNGGHDIDLRRMAADGVTLLGYLQAITEGKLLLAPDLEENLEKGDEGVTNFKNSVDFYVKKTGLDIPEKSRVEEDVVVLEEIPPILELDLKATGITSVIWASGFRYGFGWVKLPVLDEAGDPVHRRGVTRCPGIYFLGLKWLYKLKSSFISGGGVAEDAAYLAAQIEARR